MEKERRERFAETLVVETGKGFGLLRLRVLMEVGDTEIPNGTVRISWTVFYLCLSTIADSLFLFLGGELVSVIKGHTAEQSRAEQHCV